MPKPIEAFRPATGEGKNAKRVIAFCISVIAYVSLEENAHAQDMNTRYEFHIEAESLGEALDDFVVQTGLMVLFPQELADAEGMNPVIGTFSASEAISKLFTGTEFSGGLTKSGAIFIAQDKTSREGEMTSGNIKKGLLASVSALLFGAGSQVGALAQTDAQSDGVETEETVAEAASGAKDQIIVTGSRLEQTALTADNPVRVINSEQIKLSGFTDIADVLDQTPGLTIGPDNGGGANSSRPGLQTISLRGLGPERTLTLINGRRQVPGVIGTAAVDISTIPSSLVDRIEVVTGGGSSVYGTDAVAGVVNVITKTDFDGLDLSTTYRVTGEGDGETFQGSIVAGKNFNDDRGNVTVAFEYTKNNPALLENREFAEDFTFDFGAGAFTNITQPGLSSNGVLLFGTFFGAPTRGSSSDLLLRDDGSLTGTPGNSVAISSDGASFIPHDPGTIIGFGFAQGGDGTPFLPVADQLSPENERFIGIANFNYELTPTIEAFLETKYVHRNTVSVDGPRTRFLGVGLDNPFLPAGITPGLIAGQTPPFPAPVDPTTVYLGKSLDDLGPRVTDSTTELFAGAAGLKGQFSDRINWEVFVTYGRTELDQLNLNDVNINNLALAADATTDGMGGIICRDPNPITSANEAVDAGCAPLNIFGNGNASAEALAFVRAGLSINTVQDQLSAGFFVGGEAFNAPAGPVNFSAGYSFREDSTDSRPSDDFVNGASPLFEINPIAGEIRVHEAFAEIGVPIVRDLPMFQSVDVSGSASVAHYNTVGTIGAFKFSGAWQVIDDIRFRGSYARAVRAPNIGEAFPFSSSSIGLIFDPCSAVGVNVFTDDPAQALANCQAEIGSLAPILGPPVVPLTISTGPNPDLTEETSTTYTVGVVLQPTFIEGLSITVDYYDVVIEDAITTVNLITILQGCYNAPAFPGPTCDLLERDAVTGGLSRVLVQPTNVESFETSGIDFSVNYFADVANLVGSERDLGNIGINYAGLYDLEGITRTVGTPEGIEQVGFGGRPHYQHTSSVIYSNGPASLQTTWRFAGRSEPVLNDITNEGFGSRSYFDMSLNYDVIDEVDLTFGVTNLTDKEPRSRNASSGGARIDDLLGRTFFVRANASF